MRKPCLECGTLIHGARSRCRPCQRLRDRIRGTTTQRGYGTEHTRLRAQLLADLDPAAPCPRCTQPLGADPSLLDLGHTPNRRGWTGLEHSACNRATARRRS